MLQLRARRSNTWVETTGDVRIDPDQVTKRGHVYYKPDLTDLVAAKAPYELRFLVQDSAGDIVLFPNADAEIFEVYL